MPVPPPISAMGRFPAICIRFIRHRWVDTEWMFRNVDSDYKGIIVGDAAMAFWGAPVPQEDYVMNAVRAAADMAKGSEVLAAAPGSSCPALKSRPRSPGPHSG